MHRIVLGALLAFVALASPAAAQPDTTTTAALDSLASAADSLSAAADSLAAAAREAARRDSLAAARTRRERAQESFEAGSEQLRAQNYTGALETFERGLRIDSTNILNTYGRAFALAQLGRNEEAIISFDRAIRMAEAEDDTAAVRLARTSREGVVSQWTASTYATVDPLIQAEPIPKESGEQAVSLLAPLATGLQNDLGFNYRYARALNAAERFADAALHAEQAVNLSVNEADRSPYYYELGMSLKGMNQVGQARTAFEQARTGTWGQWAEYQLGVLATMTGGGGN
ncbi:MAG TPA: hypothetical protein VD962_03450 [Rubricoccaceae bacterium]|nr:hypothetical protein [Rubricoccaceae bacterium]